MIRTATVYCRQEDGRAAGLALGRGIAERMEGLRPDVVIVFASPRYDYEALLRGLHESCRPKVVTGCSSAGEFTGSDSGVASASAMAIRSDEMQFSVGMANRITEDRRRAARQIFATLSGENEPGYPYRYAMVLTDALGGYVEDLVAELARRSRGRHRFFGAGAGDDARFERTHVFYGRWHHSDAAVVLEILSKHPVGIGAHHGWVAASKTMTVDASRGAVVERIDGQPALAAFQAHAQRTGQALDLSDPLGFFLHNCVGVEAPGGHVIRVPLKITGDGIAFAAEIPAGSRIAIMKTTAKSAREAAQEAAREATSGLAGRRPAAALFFDCAATRLRLGREFGLELAAVSRILGDAPLAGCNSYGQIISAPGQFNGFHNCTAVACVFPDDAP